MLALSAKKMASSKEEFSMTEPSTNASAFHYVSLFLLAQQYVAATIQQNTCSNYLRVARLQLNASQKEHVVRETSMNPDFFHIRHSFFFAALL